MMLSLSHLSGDSRISRSLVYSPRLETQRLASNFSGLSGTSTINGEELGLGDGVDDLTVAEKEEGSVVSILEEELVVVVVVVTVVVVVEVEEGLVVAPLNPSISSPLTPSPFSFPSTPSPLTLRSTLLPLTPFTPLPLKPSAP